MSAATLPIDEAVTPPLRTDECGVIRVGKTRITLSTLIGFYNQGQSPEELAQGFPTLSLADIYGVLFYYLNHRSAIDAYLDQLDRDAEILRKEMESRPESIRMRKRLKERAMQRENSGAAVPGR